MTNKLYILTTATPRAELHKHTCMPVYKTLKQCKDFDTTIVVNLDKPTMIEQSEFHKSIYTLYPRVDYLSSNIINPSFSLAGRTLYNICSNIVSEKNNNLFLWLEDDWQLKQGTERLLIEVINKMFRDKNIPALLTTIYNYIGGNPVVFQQKLFDKVVEVWNRSCKTKQEDPEFIHMQAQSEIDGTHIWRNPPQHALHSSEALFLDAGRDWRKKNNIGKLRREKTNGTWVQDKLGRNDL